MAEGRLNLRGIGIAVVTTAALFAVGCEGSGYYIDLPGSLFLDHDGALEIRVLDLTTYGAREIAVDNNVTAYGFTTDVIYGYVTHDGIPWPSSTKEGYFLIDVNSKKARVGLPKSEWTDALRNYGIAGEPQIAPPSWNERTTAEQIGIM